MDYRSFWNNRYATLQNESASLPDEDQAERWNAVYAWYLRRWLPEDTQAPILELGCGQGSFLEFLKSRGYAQVRGIDSSREQAALCEKRGLAVTQGDALDFLRNNDHKFAAIVALDFIEHLTRDEALMFLELAFGALEPGGRLILQTPNGESPWVGSVFHGDLTHETCYTPHLLKKLLLSQGFRGIQLRPCGPPPVDMQSSIRKLIWDGITLVCRGLNLIEGAVTSGIYTRVFMVSAQVPE